MCVIAAHQEGKSDMELCPKFCGWEKLDLVKVECRGTCQTFWRLLNITYDHQRDFGLTASQDVTEVYASRVYTGIPFC